MNTNLNFDDNEIRRNIIEENQMKEKQMALYNEFDRDGDIKI